MVPRTANQPPIMATTTTANSASVQRPEAEVRFEATTTMKKASDR